jgi:two-component system cell cycle sensor histidine kinase/response regulator CckA
MSKNSPSIGKTVLLAEGQSSLRMFVCKALAREGYQVVCASDGRKALQTGARHDCAIDLLVTDVILPGFYGCHLAELMKLDYPQLKVVYLASFTDRDIRALGRDSKVILLQYSGWTRALVGAVREVLANPVAPTL